MRRTLWILLLAACGSAPRPQSESDDAPIEPPTSQEVREALRGWDARLCKMAPRELILAERLLERRARREGVTVPESEVANRAARKRKAAESSVRSRGATLAEYLGAVGAEEPLFATWTVREARVEAIASRFVLLDERRGKTYPEVKGEIEELLRSKPPSDALVVAAIRLWVESSPELKRS